MREQNSRGARPFISGTGLYIALFLVLTALAVAGYWMLLPSPAVSTPVESVVSPTVVAPIVAEPVEPDIPEIEPEPESTPATASAVIALPEPSEPAQTYTPTAPRLVVSPLVGETVAAFSVDELAYNETLADWRTHDGIDIKAPAGTHVLAACSGTVLSVSDDDLMGTTVVIAHGDGYETTYANLQSVPTVAPEQYVSAGQVIGSVGETSLVEAASGAHLHFAVTKDGQSVDPQEFLKG